MRKLVLSTVFVALLTLWCTHSALAQCVQAGSNRANYGSVRLSVITPDIPSTLQQGITAGMGAWNAANCNTSGTAFPQFTTSGSADATIEVFFRSGLNPSDNSLCAAFDGR